MAFWSDSTTPEPLRQNRWYIQFGNLSGYQYALKACSKPEYDIGVSEHVLLNHTFRYPKNLVWKPITVKMISVTVGNSEDQKITLTEKIYNLIRNSGYGVVSDEEGISKQSLSNGLGGSIQITQIDSNGNDIEKWNLFNPFINNVKFGNLSYDNDGFVDIDLTVQYDYATLVKENSPQEEGLKRNNFTIFGLDTGINNFLEPTQEKTFTPGFPGQRR